MQINTASGSTQGPWPREAADERTLRPVGAGSSSSITVFEHRLDGSPLVAPGSAAEGERIIPTRNTDLFYRTNVRMELPGREGRSNHLFYGGLGGTSYPWLEIADRMNSEFGARAVLCTLPGHTGSWDALYSVSRDAWVQEITVQAKLLDKPVAWMYSTAATAALRAEALEPGLFRALVLVGTAIEMRNGVKHLMMRGGDYLSMLGGYVADRIGNIEVSLHSDEPAEMPSEVLCIPSMEFVPGSSVVQLSRLQRETAPLLSRVRCPVFLAHGADDELISPHSSKVVFRRIASEHKEKPRLYRGGHAVMRDVDADAFAGDVEEWLRERKLL